MSTLTPLVIDVETTIKNKGNVYTKDNKLCYIGEYDGVSLRIYNWMDASSFSKFPVYNERRLIAFNAKFDLGWLRRYGIDYSQCTIWDCQLAHFVLSGQTTPYPSLNDVCEYYVLGRKLDIISEQYWDKGIDTPDIPPEIMEEYLAQDLKLTWQVYLKQVEEFEKQPQLFKLFQMQCEDLLTLLEMEWNGQVVDVETCKEKEKECEEKVQEIDKELQSIIGDIPVNFGSNDHCSVILYGGTIKHETRVPVGVFKTGIKAGQIRNKVVTYEFNLPRLIEPPKGSELQKEGYFSTDEPTLRSCRGSRQAKRIIDLLLARSRYEKLRGTYYKGIPDKMREIDSFDGRLHGQFNQCMARTGRLSSSNPNLQNLPGEMKQMMGSRYE